MPKTYGRTKPFSKGRLEAMATLKMSGFVLPLAMQDKA